MREIDWYGLHGEPWSDLAPGSVKHPAKFSRALIRRIYDHLAESGYLVPGYRVLDPFGGIAGGAPDAMRHGCHYVGVELEERFWKLGLANISHWNRLYGQAAPVWGTAEFYNSDSRFLTELLSQAVDLSIGSPPYGEGETRDRSKFSGGEIASMMSRAYTQDRQGITPGNLNTARARDEDFDAVVSSPPYEDVIRSGEGPGARWDEKSHSLANSKKVTNDPEYGRSAGQIGTSSGESFWSMARQVVDQTYQVVRPGGVSVWTVRDFVRKGRRAPFCDQWMKLCESAGYEPVEYIRSWLVRTVAEHHTLFGDIHVETRTNKTMFRILAERNGSPAIDYEVVLVMRKPE